MLNFANISSPSAGRPRYPQIRGSNNLSCISYILRFPVKIKNQKFRTNPKVLPLRLFYSLFPPRAIRTLTITPCAKRLSENSALMGGQLSLKLSCTNHELKIDKCRRRRRKETLTSPLGHAPTQTTVRLANYKQTLIQTQFSLEKLRTTRLYEMLAFSNKPTLL